MLLTMKTLIVRICLVLLGICMLILWIPAAGYNLLVAWQEGRSARVAIADLALQARFDAEMFWIAFKHPIEDEDEVNGV